MVSNSTTTVSGVGNKNASHSSSLCNNPEECDLLDEDEDEKENSFSKMENNNKKK
jgi:hypothetical protein